MVRKKILTPFSLPIYCFALAIVTGAVVLHSKISLTHEPITWVDAFFTAVSAVCVTGLSVVDTGSFFSSVGHSAILCMIQLGGLGVMTYSSLAFYLWRQRVSLTDRLAVGQSLLHDPSFHLGRFLFFMFIFTFAIELFGALLLFLHSPAHFNFFSAFFHSVSAFCNAGFSLQADSLMQWRNNLGVNLVFIMLITLGGLGFSVLVESFRNVRHFVLHRINPALTKNAQKPTIRFHTRTVLRTSLFLVFAGAIAIFLAEYLAFREAPAPSATNGFWETLLSGLFQSVSCRTAGFNTLDISHMTNVSLAFMILLMFIGGSPGSCAGGVKTTTFRTILAFIVSQLKGRQQTIIGHRAVDGETLNKALSLIIFGGVIIFVSTLILSITEGGDTPHYLVRVKFLDILFEVVSAFGTAGLSTGLTPSLSTPGKIVIMILMFVGRIGPILFLTALQNWQTEPRYAWPEENLMIG